MNESKEKIIADEDPTRSGHTLPDQEDDDSTVSSNSTIVDFPLQPTRPPTSSSNQGDQIGYSSSSLNRKESSKSKATNGRSFKTIRSVATRLKVAQQLSIAKRTGRDSVSIAGGAMPEEPTSAIFGSRPDFGSKPSIPLQNSKRLYSDLFNSVPELPGKEGIISGGDLIFDNDFKAKVKTRPYINVMPDVDVKNIAEIMLTEWGLPVPRIAVFMLSSVGDLQTWHNTRQINAFKKGLMKAANTTNMWIVTNGLDVGVGKFIGEAIEKEQKEKRTFRYYENKNDESNSYHVIGIANDHNLAYSQQFFGKAITLGQVGPNVADNRYELNQQHSHFVVLNSANSSENGHNVLLINLIDYLTKNALLSADPEDQGNPFFGTDASKYSTFPTYNDRFGSGANTAPDSNVPTMTPTPMPIPSNGGAFKDIQLDQLAVDDTVDYLTTPETSGAPPPPETISLSHMSRQVSMSTLVPDTAGVTSKKPSFVQESKPPDLPGIVEQYPIPGVDTTHGIDSSLPANQRALSPITNRSASLLQSSIIPVVCLVIQGGYECAKLVLDNLRRRNPVIVLRGTGGFADLLSYSYLEMQQRCRDLYQSWDAEFVEHTLKPLLTTKIVKRFPQFRNNALARNMFRDRIIECVRESGSPKGRVYLSVLNMHNSSCDLENLSEYILLSLFKSQNRRDALDANLIRKDLYLTIDWNCSHVALDEVLRRNPSYNLQLEKGIFEIALIRENREDFIDLFLSHGFQVHKFLTPFRLRRLIRSSLSESDFFRTICMENILGIAVWSYNFEEMLDKLSMSTSECPDADSFISNELNQLIFACTSLHNFVSVDQLYMNIMGLYQIDVESTERKTLAILAMWAVFNQKFKLAQILWKHSDQPIHLGLILSMMLDRMAWFVAEQNLKDELTKHSKSFEQAVIGVLDVCYRQDEKRSFDLLSQENSDWDQKTAVDIAANGRHRAFIAHPCCQKWLTSTFNGRIRIRELTWGFITVSPVIKIILSAFLIFPMYIWIRFLEDDESAKAKRKSLEEIQSTEGDQSENEEDKFLSDHMKMIELNRAKESGDQSAKRPVSGDEWRDTLNQLRGHTGKDGRDTFRQRRLFIKKQPPLWKMIYLMWSSPITKFWTYQVFYIFYLAIFSLAVIWPGCGNWYLDTTVCLWTFLNMIEHIRRTVVLFHRYTSVPMVFKLFEILGYIILLTVYSLGRVFIYDGHSFANLFDPYTMKVVLSLGLLYFYYRMFAIHLPISPTLGPLLYRFKLMVTVDFLHFMRMALILLISSGIVIQAILYPNTELSVDTFHKAFHRAAISLFLTPVEELTVKCNHTNASFAYSLTNTTERKFVFTTLPDKCPASPTSMEDSCPRTGFWAYFFSFQFLIFLKLILMTLLYALFASTATKLQSDTDNIWKFQRYTLVIDFANRPLLHAPLSIFVYLWELFTTMFRILTCRCLKCGRSKKDHVDNKVLIIPEHEDDAGNRLSQEDYNFWRHLAKTYYEDEQKKKDKADSANRQTETIQMICEEIEHSKHVLRSMKTKITEMERLMFQSQIYLEDIKHCTISGHTTSATTVDLPLSTSGGIHYLSRHSPYVGTRIQRFPLADKFVSWDVIWINYDPVIYSRKREDFPVLLKPFVDEDILAIKERLNSVISDVSADKKHIHLPVFNWNAISVNPAGLTIDRRSWLITGGHQQQELTTKPDNGDSIRTIIYKLDDGIPLNPFGRTGLRGKGNLPRWGPNHYMMLFLTRSNTGSSGTILEFALELKLNVLSIPMRFVGDDKPFTEIRHLIAKDDTFQDWATEADMVAYFESRVARTSPNSVSVRCEPSTVHYMDSPDNTDNAWKELKVYHIHFTCTGPSALTDSLVRSSAASSSSSSPSHAHSTLIWLISTEDLLVRIPMEQVSFMNAIIRRFQQQQSNPK